MPFNLVDRVMDKEKKKWKKRRAEEEERPKGWLTPHPPTKKQKQLQRAGTITSKTERFFVEILTRNTCCKY
jgi:hypothetical protein